jgi:hypothetical protein
LESYESGLTPDIVPIPPASAQAPEVLPLVTQHPFPPSIRGRTSAPDIFNEFKVGNKSYFPFFI